MMSHVIASSTCVQDQTEVFSSAMDGLAHVGRQALTGMCLGAVGLGVILSVATVLIGAVEFGIGGTGPALPPGQLAIH